MKKHSSRLLYSAGLDMKTKSSSFHIIRMFERARLLELDPCDILFKEMLTKECTPPQNLHLLSNSEVKDLLIIKSTCAFYCNSKKVWLRHLVEISIQYYDNDPKEKANHYISI